MAAETARLMIYDLEQGAASVVLETDLQIAAPNWTPDGEALVVNGEGSLFWVDLETPELLEIDTGLCIKLNNDHGLSPDGSTLYFSDHTFGKGAVIWRMDLEDDADPERVSQKAPSWWHAASPGGERIAYTAVRDAVFGIYTSRTDGTDETCVIGGPHHYDGPDYTPDGAWLWFNSDRSGQSQLWRIRPDGTDLEQMTDDSRVNWFPHPSPEDGHVVYLSYPEGTEGHPSDLDVELRLWRGVGQEPRTLMTLRGGQGTLNVPSWAPDGSAFAYVAYSAD